MRSDERKNIEKIANLFKNNGNSLLWPREIARKIGLHHKTVGRLVSKFPDIFEIVENSNFAYDRVKFLRLQEKK